MATSVPYNIRELPPEPELMPQDDLDVEIDDAGNAVTFDPSGAVTIENGDGTVTVDFGGQPVDTEKSKEHDSNLALHLSESELNVIASELLQGIAADESSRQEWLETRATGIGLLGLKLETPGNTDTQSSAPMEGQSRVRHPLLLEATLRFQANARGELLPSSGPVKVRNDGAETTNKDLLAEALEKDFNHYLTVRAKEYYPDTDRALFYTGFGGCSFKKVYRCPIRQRPVSESIDAADLIVTNAATDMLNAGRVTHRIMMRRSTMRRMQMVGAYRDVSLTQTPQPDINAVDRKVAEVQGINPQLQQPEDNDYTVYECYCELDIPGFEHKDKSGEKTGLELPYCVVLEKDSRQVLAIRRNWREDDDLCLAKIPFVKYPFVPGLGFYDIGLIHILGNTTAALTAAWRIMLDAGMFANFPGFLFLKSMLRQTTNEFRIPPGGGMGLDANGTDIRQVVMPLPYKEPGPALMSLTENIGTTGQRVGGTAEVVVGEGRQDAPVGTTIALIEQATKIVDAVHKRLHAAQAEEFGLLKELFQDDPEALWRGHRKSALVQCCNASPDDEAAQEVMRKRVIEALSDNDLVPAADPNTPSHMHRVMRAMAIKQLQAMNPALYDAKKVDERVLAMIHVDDPASLFAPPSEPGAPPGPTPDKLLDAKVKAATKMDELRVKSQTEAAKLRDNAAERESREKLAVLELAQTLAVHPESEGIVRQTIGEGT